MRNRIARFTSQGALIALACDAVNGISYSNSKIHLAINGDSNSFTSEDGARVYGRVTRNVEGQTRGWVVLSDHTGKAAIRAKQVAAVAFSDDRLIRITFRDTSSLLWCVEEGYDGEATYEAFIAAWANGGGGVECPMNDESFR